MGCRLTTVRNAHAIRSRGAASCRSIRSAKNRAASTKVLLFIKVNACNGVVVRSVRTMHTSRAAALKVIIVGGGTVRRQ